MNVSDVLKCFHVKNNLKELFAHQKQGQIPVIDAFRGLSFHWVFVFHLLYIIPFFLDKHDQILFYQKTSALSFFWRGTLGVDVFFVISGFLISYILLKEHSQSGKLKIGRFYLGRFLRLMPVYFAAILVIYFFFPVEFQAIQRLPRENAWTNMLYINNFLSYADQFMLWSWSLAVEEQFYIIFPFMFLLLVRLKRHRVISLLFLVIVSLVVRAGLSPFALEKTSADLPLLLDASPMFFDAIYDKLHTRFGAILLGILAAFLFFHHQQTIDRLLDNLKIKLPVIEILLVFLLGVIAMIIPDPASVSGHWFLISFRTVFSLIITMQLLLYLSNKDRKLLLTGFLERKFWFPLAQLSYSAYIWHPMIIFSFYFLFWQQDNVLSFAEICVVCLLSYFTTLLVSALSYVLIEKPFMNLRKLI